MKRGYVLKDMFNLSNLHLISSNYKKNKDKNIRYQNRKKEYLFVFIRGLSFLVQRKSNGERLCS